MAPWDTFHDEFVMSIEGIASAASLITPTKRSIVSLVSKFYNPLGFISPLVTLFKIFLQELCEVQLNWDEPLTEALQTRWQYLSQSLTAGRQVIRVTRCATNLNEDQPSNYQLCGFCDASLKAYAAVVYLLRETDDGVMYCPNAIRILILVDSSQLHMCIEYSIMSSCNKNTRIRQYITPSSVSLNR